MSSKRHGRSTTIEVDPQQILSSERREVGHRRTSKPSPPPPPKPKRRPATEEVNPQQIIGGADDATDGEIDPGTSDTDPSSTVEDLDTLLGEEGGDPVDPSDEKPSAAATEADFEDFGALDQRPITDEHTEAVVPSATAMTSSTGTHKSAPGR